MEQQIEELMKQVEILSKEKTLFRNYQAKQALNLCTRILKLAEQQLTETQENVPLFQEIDEGISDAMIVNGLKIMASNYSSHQMAEKGLGGIGGRPKTDAMYLFYKSICFPAELRFSKTRKIEKITDFDLVGQTTQYAFWKQVAAGTQKQMIFKTSEMFTFKKLK
jgi:hypothetical protein